MWRIWNWGVGGAGGGKNNLMEVVDSDENVFEEKDDDVFQRIGPYVKYLKWAEDVGRLEGVARQFGYDTGRIGQVVRYGGLTAGALRTAYSYLARERKHMYGYRPHYRTKTIREVNLSGLGKVRRAGGNKKRKYRNWSAPQSSGIQKRKSIYQQ